MKPLAAGVLAALPTLVLARWATDTTSLVVLATWGACGRSPSLQ